MLLIWKAFKVKWMAFSFWNIFFHFRDIHVFVLCKWGKRWRHKQFHLNNKILNQEYLHKYWSSVLQTWHQKCASQKKQNDTYYVIAMATLLAPVSFCEKPNIPICNLLKWDRRFCSEHTGFPFCLNSLH